MHNGSNGRKANGQFDKGWKGGPGTPHIKRALELKEAAVNAVTPEQYADAVKHMMEIACDRNDHPNAIAAFRELSNRLIGKPAEAPSLDDGMKQQYPILVTTTAEAMKALEERRKLDPDCLDPRCGYKPRSAPEADE